jgi:hypothetical protein
MIIFKEERMSHYVETPQKAPLRLSSLAPYLILLYAVALPLFIVSFFVASTNGPFTMIGGVMASGTASNALFVFAGLAVFAAQIYFLVLLFRAWRFTIDELKKQNLKPAVSSAGKALGFAFIPGFNLYWLFVLFGKLMTEVNRLAVARGRSERLPSWLGFAIPPLLLLMLVTPWTSVPAFLVGVFAAYPLFISLVVSFLSTLSDKAEPVKTISAYHDIFERKTFGQNLHFVVAFFIAQEIAVASQAWLLSLGEKAPVMLAFTPINIINYIALPLLFTACWYAVTVFVKNDWLAAVFFGLAQLALQFLSLVILYPLRFDPELIVWMASQFLDGFLLLLGLVLVVRLSGVRLGGFVLAPLAPALLETVYWLIRGVPMAGGLMRALVTGALLYGGLSLGLASRKFGLAQKEIVRLG